MGMVIILEIVRIVLAAAVGYIVANKMARTSVAMKDNTEGKKKITNTEEEVNNIPAMISFSPSEEANSSTDKRPLLLKSSMQSDDMSEDHQVDIDESDRCCSVMSVDPPGQLVRQRSKRMNDLSEIDPPFHVQAESMWNKKQTNVLQNEHDEEVYDRQHSSDSVSSSSVGMIQQMEDTHNRELLRLQRIHRHQTQIKKQGRRMSSISWEDTDGEEDEAEATTKQMPPFTKQMPPFLAKYQSSEQEKEETYKKNVTNRRGSKQKQDDIRLMLGLHSSSEKSTCTRRNSYYTLARSPKLSCLRNNRRKSASNAAA